MRNYLIGLCLIACGCASVKKSGTRTESTSQHTDSSSVYKEHAKVTTTTETAGVPVTTYPDSVGFTSYLPVEDTMGFHQQVTAGAVTLAATVKPRRDNKGKTTGYDITASATKAPEVIIAPVNRQTTIAENGRELQRAAVKDVAVSKSATTDKSVFRLNAAGIITIVLCVLGAVALYLLYRYFKPLKPVKNEKN